MIGVTGVIYFGATTVDEYVDKNGDSDFVKITKLNEVAGQDKLKVLTDKTIAVPLGLYEARLKYGIIQGDTIEREKRVMQGFEEARKKQ